jgi:hypothetical protein
MERRSQRSGDEIVCRRCGKPMIVVYSCNGVGGRQLWCCVSCSVYRIVKLPGEAEVPDSIDGITVPPDTVRLSSGAAVEPDAHDGGVL